MIVFDLECRAGGHRFEGWFGSSADFADQRERGLVACPSCGSADVDKALTAPRLARKGNQLAPVALTQKAVKPQPMAGGALPPEAVEVMRAIATLQAEALKSSTWVGDRFAEDARAMHYGERDPAPIHGKATREEAMDLAEEGIPIAPILFPIVPPGEAN